MSDKLKVYEALARALKEGGDPVFGLVGDANLYMVDYFVRQYGGRYYSAANEAGATMMALGYATVTGRTGFVSVTHGPAVTNTLTGLVEGVKSFTPLVLLCGDTNIVDRENLQNVAQRDVILATGAGFEQMRSPETALEDLARAVSRAHAERRPVALNVPTNLQHETIDYRPRPWFDRFVPPGAPSAGDDLDNAIGIIASSKRPIVLAGRGASTEAARDALVRLAERIEAPLATTLRAKDLFRGADYNLGIFGTLSTEATVDAILKSDCVIAFGASLNTYTTAERSYLEGKRVVQIGSSPADIGRGALPDVGLVGGVTETVDVILHWLDEAEIPPSGFRAELQAQGMADHPVPRPEAGAEALDYVATLAQLEALLPADRFLVTDAGRFLMKAMKHLSVETPWRFAPTASFGSIGLGMGYAIGAAASDPARTTVLVIGDGGFMLGGLMEFHSAVRHGTNLIVVLCNDGSYGAEHIQMRAKQMDPELILFDWPEFAPLAAALGGTGVTVRSPADLDRVAEAIAAPARPLLIDLRLDPDRMPFY